MMSDIKLSLVARWVVCCLLLVTSSMAYTVDKTILVYGDSISAAYGMEENQGWVELLTERIAQEKLPYEVINASVSGETTGGGLVRLPKTLELHQPDVVILELGGNDGLRGYPIDRIEDNLMQMTEMAKGVGAEVLLVGMVLPPNYGKRYIDGFTAIFPAVAREHDVPLLPVVLDGVATPESLIQGDGIHPRPEAQPMIVEQIWPKLLPLLQAKSEQIELEASGVGDQ